MRRHFVAAVIGSVLSLGFSAKADTLGAQFVSSQQSVFNGGVGSFGFSFATSSPIAIDALAYHSPATTGGAIRLYNSLGTVLASATIFPTNPGLTTGGYAYNSAGILPVQLAANATYYIVADVPRASQIILLQSVGLTMAPGLSYTGSVSEASVFGNPTTDAFGQPNSYLTANFEVAPEPASAYLVSAFGLGALLFHLKKRGFRFRGACEQQAS